jgi:hypothetical protein
MNAARVYAFGDVYCTDGCQLDNKAATFRSDCRRPDKKEWPVMLDENRFPTMRFMKCRKCGNVFVASLSGVTTCPECSSEDAEQFSPDSESSPSRKKPAAPQA